VLHGCSVLVVLRRKHTPRDQNDKNEGDPGTQDVTYGFIGECYLHGFMNGKAFQDHGRGTLEIRKFHLV